MKMPTLLTRIALALGAGSMAWAQGPASPEGDVPFTPNGRVALLTDYGVQDFYAGALKGAIASRAPEALIDDVTHGVPAFDIAGGAFLLSAAAREWPAGTVFTAIVDPGVGTERLPIVLRTGNGLVFVGPDNGLFTRVAVEMGIAEVREIANEALLRPGALSSTFHGRDLFGPIAGFLAAGGALSDVGPERGDIVRLRLVDPDVEDGEIRGQVLLADRYGNLLTNVPATLLAGQGIEQGATLTLMVAGQTVSAPFVRTYGDAGVGENLCLINSQGLLEFATNQGDLAGTLGVNSGDEIRIRPGVFQ